MEEAEFKLDFSKFKGVRLTYVLLVLFLILGLYLRVYHLDFPSIGYHNMKENEYLDEAYFFLHQGNYLHKQAFAFFGFDEGTGYHEEYAEVPFVSYLTAIGWAIFGESLWLPRLFMIAFMLGSIFITYFLVKRLTNSEYLSLLSSFLIAVMPLGIYFGRNIQPESPGLFFILLAAFYFVKWLDTKDAKNLMYTGFSFSVAWGLKYTFGIIAVPLLFIMPWNELYHGFKQKSKEFYSIVKYAFYGILPGIFLTLLYELTVVDRSKAGYLIEPLRIFTEQGYWTKRIPGIMSYLNDNFTWWFVWFAIIGLAFVVLKYRTRFSRFLIGYTLSIFIYVDLLSSKIGGHAYYQMPYLPLICILSAYFLFLLGTLLKQALNHRVALYTPLLLILLAIPSMQAANDRVWGTNFYGQDFLGGYLKARLEPNERFAAYTHSQDLATCSYSRHRCGSAGSLDELLHKEKVFNLRYIYIGVSEFDKLSGSNPLWKYILNNYHIDLVGLMNINGKLTPMHFILKRGGKFNMTDVQGKPVQPATTYDTKQGQVPYYFIQNVQA